MSKLVLWFTLLLIRIKSAECLESRWVTAIAGTNCTYFLKTQRNFSKYDNHSDIGNEYAVAERKYPGCPPWYQLTEDGFCKKGPGLGHLVWFGNHTGQTWIEPFYCMTTTTKNMTRVDAVGNCIFSASVNRKNVYIPLPCSISELNEFMCAGPNREGQLCGKCRKGFAPPVYSYSLSCVNCTEYSLNWLKYLAVAFGPLTVFSIVVTVIHISPTSPYLHGFIFYSHIFSMPAIIRLVSVSYGYQNYYNTRLIMKIYFSILGVWNLDFFRLVYEPFCIHPNVTLVQVLAMDFLVAAYPLVLVSVTYLLVSLYNRNCKLVKAVWRPFRYVLRPVLRYMNIQTSLIESFATLYLLSIVKFQSVTLDLLVPSRLHYLGGKQSESLYLYWAGEVKYFGPDHLPYAILAIVLFTLLVIIPTFLLFFYPCHCFQQCLNRLHCNSHKLRTFMDVFQGHYKNGTDQSLDLRYFSGIFFVTRTIFIVSFAMLNSYTTAVIFGLYLIVLSFSISILHPQVTKAHYCLDLLFLIFLSTLLFSCVGYILAPYQSIPLAVSLLLWNIAAALPVVYIITLFLYWIFKKKALLKCILFFVSRIASGYTLPDEE